MLCHNVKTMHKQHYVPVGISVIPIPIQGFNITAPYMDFVTHKEIVPSVILQKDIL